MKITYIGHACFKVEKDGFAIVIDPYADGYVPGLADVRETANMVLCTHGHDDHAAVGNVAVTENADSPFTITEIKTYHDPEQGAQRGENTIYIIDDGVNRVAHLGDLGCELTPEQEEELGGLDVLMVPVGGCYTIGPREAAELTLALDPRVAIPMHYRGVERPFGFDELATVYDYAALIKGVIVKAGSEMESEDELPCRVLVIQPQNS